ncbi:hypothetical protein [Niastella populi]|uniref:Uncharacterized protein n=1 Tax=Niastella populi TaxID=550983 RepID=A0A1V9FL90_9BACT|nr:hypothetical protein [Niastella populi]OQP58996.1 hypothetical protein A4R26_21645 [Niastella populi]
MKPDNDTLHKVMVNETLIHKLGIQQPEKAIGVRLRGAGEMVTIAGVVKTFKANRNTNQEDPVSSITIAVAFSG